MAQYFEEIYPPGHLVEGFKDQLVVDAEAKGTWNQPPAHVVQAFKDADMDVIKKSLHDGSLEGCDCRELAWRKVRDYIAWCVGNSDRRNQAAGFFQDARLAGVNLSGVNLSGFDFSGASFSGATLEKTDLSYTVCRKARFEHARLNRAHLQYAILEGANCGESQFRAAQLSSARLQGARLFGADWRRANLEGADLSDVNALGALFTHARLSHATLDRARLDMTDFSTAILVGARLHQSHVGGAHFEFADLRQAKLTELQWCRDCTRLKCAQLGGTDFSGTRLPSEPYGVVFMFQGSTLQHSQNVLAGVSDMHCKTLAQGYLGAMKRMQKEINYDIAKGKPVWRAHLEKEYPEYFGYSMQAPAPVPTMAASMLSVTPAPREPVRTSAAPSPPSRGPSR